LGSAHEADSGYSLSLGVLSGVLSRTGDSGPAKVAITGRRAPVEPALGIHLHGR
jgi:hypothetical protein